jgi:multimeric flavodoxin WrbA
MDGFNESGEEQAEIIAAVTNELSGRAWDGDVLTTRDLELAPCTGCFGCWTKRPGMCVQDDDAGLLCRKIMESDLILIVSPVTFGGYSSSVKKAIDRTICLISPFFMIVGGEVHHKPRYDHIPARATLGFNHDKCKSCAQIFETLHYRNAINFHLPAMAVDIVEEGDTAGDGLKARITRLLDKVSSSVFSDFPDRRIRRDEFVAEADTRLTLVPAEDSGKKALILTGSPKVSSTSSSIGDDFSVRLRERDWQTEIIRILPSVRSRDKWLSLTDAMAEADIVVLLAPLYADSLPAPVTEAFESMAEQRKNDPGRQNQGFMAVLNCGFPEAFHNYTGLAIARQFALEAGFKWMGGLALGMGGFIDGNPLPERGRLVRNVRKALALTAAALDRGEPVPPEAVDLMEKPFMPRWLYIAFGNWGWKRQARKHGVMDMVHAQPYK